MDKFQMNVNCEDENKLWRIRTRDENILEKRNKFEFLQFTAYKCIIVTQQSSVLT